jgi:2'-hydroxyisoflavone reductase
MTAPTALRILVIGGTRFIGRHLVEHALTAGHSVTLLHRGQSAHDLFPDAEHRIGDRDDDLALLAAGEWDVTIDMCAYFPRQVHALADALDGRGGRYTLISSVSVYQSPLPTNFAETAPLIELSGPVPTEVTANTYGGLKVLCERAALERFGTDTLIVRPTYVVGPHDLSWRFPWWVMKLAQGGDVLAPGPRHSPMQLIDARPCAMDCRHERADSVRRVSHCRPR